LFEEPIYQLALHNPNITCPYSQQEYKGWKQKFNNADFGSKKEEYQGDHLIQWAGGLHQRGDFNKRRDNLGQWTEVLFHH
jgi:hypothetical protein